MKKIDSIYVRTSNSIYGPEDTIYMLVPPWMNTDFRAKRVLRALRVAYKKEFVKSKGKE